MAVQKGPGGAYWIVQDNEGNAVGTYESKEAAEAADAVSVPPEIEEAGVDDEGDEE
jgi:hypothetical protein|tara:strand:- start:2837 stop:3004 length:168 start_codon:yes stop_codon:yes gene_type:complete